MHRWSGKISLIQSLYSPIRAEDGLGLRIMVIITMKITMTDDDNEIIKLAKVLHTPCPRKHVVKDLVDKINSANVKYGWVLLKANKFLAN